MVVSLGYVKKCDGMVRIAISSPTGREAVRKHAMTLVKLLHL